MPDPTAPAEVREADARQRALRTLVQFLVVEVLVTVLPLVVAALDPGGTLDVRALAKAAVRALAGALLAYLMGKRIPPPPTPAALKAIDVAVTERAEALPPAPLSAADGLHDALRPDAPVSDAPDPTPNPRRRR